jgi:shikimate kinase
MIISLVGMSGVGKSYWSVRLKRELDFEVFCCDDEIEKKLSPVLSKLGLKGINDMNKWMGHPFESQYEENSRTYLELENQTMLEILKRIEKGEFLNKNLVIDTTGSLVYTNPEIQKQLKSLTKVIYLKAGQEDVEKMYQTFLSDPKPIIWGNSFTPNTKLTNQQNLEICYPKLLQFRSKKYQELADKTINIKDLYNQNFDIAWFLED